MTYCTSQMSKQGSSFPPCWVLFRMHSISKVCCCAVGQQCSALCCKVDLPLALHEVAGMSPLPPCRPGLQLKCPGLA